MVDKVAQPANEVIQLAEVVAKLLPSFFGKTTTESGSGTSASNLSGSTTGTQATSQTGTTGTTGSTGTTGTTGTDESTTGGTKKSIDSGTQSQLDALMATILPAAQGNTTQMDAVVQNIFRKAAEAFAPTLGQANQAGVHNDSTRELLRNDAIARATGEASAAVFQAQQQAAATASNLLRTQAEGNAGAVQTGGKQGTVQQQQQVAEQRQVAEQKQGTQNTTGTEQKSVNTATTENKTSSTQPTINLFGKAGNPLEALLMAGITAYGGQKLKKLVGPELDKIFGSEGGSGSAINSGLSGDSLDAFFGGGPGTSVLSETPSAALSYGAGSDSLAFGGGSSAGQALLDSGAITFSADAGGVEAGAGSVVTTAVADEGVAAGVAGGISELVSGGTGSDVAGAVGSSAGAGSTALGPVGEESSILAAEEFAPELTSAGAAAYEAGAGAVADTSFMDLIAGGIEEIGPLALASVICTELHRQQLLPTNLWLASGKYAAGNYTPEIMDGYHYWATPMVKMLKEQPWLARMIRPVVVAYTAQCYYENNVQCSEIYSSRFGRFLHRVGPPICGWIGRMLTTTSEVRN